jgi:hypothetical protein
VLNLSDVDLSRLITHVVIHRCSNPNVLHLDTFRRLEKAGLVTAIYSMNDPEFPCDFVANAPGCELVMKMLEAGRMQQ